MAFAFEIKGRAPLNPPMKRHDEAFSLEWVWGEYTNGVADTGGEIDPECDNVLFAIAQEHIVGAAEVQIELDTASAGKFTITTVADADGRWFALVAHK